MKPVAGCEEDPAGIREILCAEIHERRNVMSWYREADGTIVVEDTDLIKTHLNHGFLLREDGKLILLDYSQLYLCGKEHKKRRFFGRRDSEEVTWKLPYKNAIKLMKKDSYDYGDCPMDKSKCRFWNDYFNICSIYSNFEMKKKEKAICLKNIGNDKKE